MIKILQENFGTRHRAAIGISKQSDSIVVVISEETGKISIAKDGSLIADVREEVLKKILISNILTKRFTNEKQNNEKKLFKFKNDKVNEIKKEDEESNQDEK